MGNIKPHVQVKLVIPILISDQAILPTVLGQIQDLWGPLDYQSEIFEFSQTSYYDEEMGLPIYRFFCSFQKLIDVDALPGIKLTTNDIEDQYRQDDKRRVNLDPGYLSPGKFVLATTKNQQHRLYIRDGIFEEITLYYHQNDWQDHPWTYYDYRTEQYKKILRHIRQLYMPQIEEFLKRPKK